MTQKIYVAPSVVDLGQAVARTLGVISPNLEGDGKRPRS